MVDQARKRQESVTTLCLLIRLIRQARTHYPGLHWWDLLVAGMEELLNQQCNRRR